MSFLQEVTPLCQLYVCKPSSSSHLLLAVWKGEKLTHQCHSISVCVFVAWVEQLVQGTAGDLGSTSAATYYFLQTLATDYNGLRIECNQVRFSHRTQNMILRCYPTVSAILRRRTKSCLLYFFNNPLFNSPKFFFTCLCSFFTCFAVLEESFQAGALLRPKHGYLVGLKCTCRTRART